MLDLKCYFFCLEEDKETFASQLLAANSKIEDQNKALRLVNPYNNVTGCLPV